MTAEPTTEATKPTETEPGDLLAEVMTEGEENGDGDEDDGNGDGDDGDTGAEVAPTLEGMAPDPDVASLLPTDPAVELTGRAEVPRYYNGSRSGSGVDHLDRECIMLRRELGDAEPTRYVPAAVTTTPLCPFCKRAAA